MYLKSVVIFLHFISLAMLSLGQPGPLHNLKFDKLADRWDEAIPLGNGQIGALIWKKDNTLRYSLDRADLWDERKALDIEKHDFKWVVEQVQNNTYKNAQEWGDRPYDAMPYPTKLPAAAMTFDLSKLGKVLSNELNLIDATHTIRFENGLSIKNFIHAAKPVGYFEITGIQGEVALPKLIPHTYAEEHSDSGQQSVVEGQKLSRLGYKQGTLKEGTNYQIIHQPTYEGRFYEVLLVWKKISSDRIIGLWTVSDNKTASLDESMSSIENGKFEEGHKTWWKNYWSQSNIRIPDPILEKQYYLEMYKFGSAARAGSPAITLQAVWTADNGGLPPWKGDFHNDLNTQLSYWPGYSGNRLAESASFTDWLWSIRDKNKAYTKQYFNVEGLNVPGVLTLNGIPMGGWIQYSLSPTVSAWTAQHFYWQWRYSMDSEFLKEKAYPYIHDVASYLEQITEMRNGRRYLPLSSSPEYNDNSIHAWFKDWTNFDLALVHYLFEAAAEVSKAMGKLEESSKWLKIRSQFPELAKDNSGLLVAVGHPMEHSHRHMSPYMAIYPLGTMDINNPEDKPIIQQSLKHLDELGTDSWVGYSFSWMASLHARGKNGDSALLNLQKFANNFCSINSFHLNGDQKGGQYSKFTYRPFTLEGNFAFAQGIHELMLQSKKGYVELFPALPSSWESLSFDNLRTEGGFLISAKRENKKLTSLKIKASEAGTINLRFEKGLVVSDGKALKKDNQNYVINLKKGEEIVLREI